MRVEPIANLAGLLKRFLCPVVIAIHSTRSPGACGLGRQANRLRHFHHQNCRKADQLGKISQMYLPVLFIPVALFR